VRCIVETRDAEHICALFALFTEHAIPFRADDA
jgi:hypothetical protein